MGCRLFFFLLLLYCSYEVIAESQSSPEAGVVIQPIKLDIGDLQPGQMKTFVWHGIPVSVYYRTAEEIEALNEELPLLQNFYSKSQIVSFSLRNYQFAIHLNDDWVRTPLRSQYDEYFVFLPISPYLGCMVKLNFDQLDNPPWDQAPDGWDGTFFDPCHEVFYDAAGRVFKHQHARYNLYVPDYRFISDTVIELIPQNEINKRSYCDLLEVVDGDSLLLNCDGVEQLVHLTGIVAPQNENNRHGECMGHPMAEKSKLSLEMFLDHKRYPGLIIEPTGAVVEGEVDAVVRVMPEYEQRIKQHFEMGPLYVKHAIDQGLSFDQYVLGYADVVEDHPQKDHYKSFKANFYQMTESSQGAFESEMGLPVPRKPKALPAACRISPLQWAEMPVIERCEIQSLCVAGQESWVSKVYKLVEHVFRLIF